jgi:hypothetical protein
MGRWKFKVLCLACAMTMAAEANNSVASEASHVSGGILLGGVTTAIVDNYFSEYAENRRAIGFWGTTLAATVVFGIEMAQDSDDVSGELLDMGCMIVGGAVGAYVTDRFILSPYVHTAPDGSSTHGVKATYRF